MVWGELLSIGFPAIYLTDVNILCTQWRSQDFILGGGGNMRGSEATEPERAERARGGGGVEGGVPPPTVGRFFFLFVYENGIFFHTKWHY